MSENEQIVRRVIDGFNRGDIDAVTALVDARVQITIEDMPDQPGSHTFDGPDGVREFIVLNRESWQSIVLEIERVTEVGDKVVVEGRNLAVGRASGVPIVQPRGAVYVLDGGKIVAADFYTHPDRARRAAGIDPEQPPA